MIFPRIKRGAQRSFLLLRQQCQSFAERPAFHAAQAGRKVAMHLLVARIITAPIPMHSDVAFAAISGDDGDPLVMIPLSKAGNLSPTLAFPGESSNPLVEGYLLSAVRVSESYHDTEQKRLAEEARVKAEAEVTAVAAATAATRLASKATVKSAPAKKVLPSNEGAAAARAISPKLSGDLKTRIEYLKPFFKEEFGKDWKIAMAIGMAESGLTADSFSPTNDHGLMQINKGFQVYGAAIYDPIENLRIAARTFYKRRGFQPWTTYNKGLYKKFMHHFND